MRNNNNNPASKPLTEPVLLILLSLADKPRHGYNLMKDIESLSNGRVQLSTGTLYGSPPQTTGGSLDRAFRAR